MPALAALVHALHVVYAALLVTAPLWLLGGALLRVAPLLDPRLRAVHLACVGWTAAQEALGLACPLTALSNHLAGRPADTPFVPVPLEGGGLALVWAAAFTYLLATAAAHLSAHRAAARGATA